LKIVCALVLGGVLYAQNTAAPPPQPPRRSAYPQRNPDPAAVERGKGLFTVNCAFCHGSDARGGEGGPSLLRSQIVLRDSNGEEIGKVLKTGLPGGMPAFNNLSPAQVSDIAAFLHSFPVNGRDFIREDLNILVGDAAAGKMFFAAKCASCHSDGLQGIATRIPDPKTLQQTWIMPGAGAFGQRGNNASSKPLPPTTVTVTLASGEKVGGKLERIDDFLVVLTDANGNERTFVRNGDQTRVEVHDPLQGHLDLLPVYSDKDIHDVTAYLATLQ
jgi:cytochrome c oxidase cbb3-type subunit 3